jgi:hypothetical protein
MAFAGESQERLRRGTLQEDIGYYPFQTTRRVEHSSRAKSRPEKQQRNACQIADLDRFVQGNPAARIVDDPKPDQGYRVGDEFRFISLPHGDRRIQLTAS